MRTIRFLLVKEFRQIFRNTTLLRIIFAVPILQLLVLPLAADYEVREIRLAVVNHDASAYSRALLQKIGASGYFTVKSKDGYTEALGLIEENRADIVLEIPARFESDLVRGYETRLLLAANAINGVKAGLGTAYLSEIIGNFNADISVIQVPRGATPSGISVKPIHWYNPHMDYAQFMVPGILAVLVTMIGAYLTALNIVREKETGTIEQINVSPIRKHHFILGKLLPFWVLGMVVFTLGLGVGWIVYDSVPQGSVLLLYAFVSVYLVAILGLGLLISTYAETQQQAMFISFFFMAIFILMAGLFTSIDNMPGWAQVISYMNPVTYFVAVMRMVTLKGSELGDIHRHLGAVLIFGACFITWAILHYRKTT